LVSAEPLKTPWLYVVAFSSDLVLGATSNDAVDPAPDSFSVASTEVRLQP